MQTLRRLARSLAALLCTACLALGAAAGTGTQDAYPSKPIRIIVPFPPGGGSDLVARTVAARLGERWKQPVLVDNRPGGNTLIAAEAAARAAPDGHTLFVAIDATLAMNQSLYRKLPYDPVKSFVPVTLAITMPMVLAAHPSVGARSMAELLAAARAQPGRLAYAHGALPAQVAGEVFKRAAVVDLLAVPYKGGAPAMTDTVAGQVPLIFDALGPAMPYLQGGKVRALAVTSAARSPLLPEVPTLAESGLPGVDLQTWIGFVVPAGTPLPIIDRLHRELTAILQMPGTRELLTGMGMTVVAGTPAQFAQTIAEDALKFGRIIEAAGIRLD
ncbi:tripartite tricarboxylate transporter substrate binding protein [Delftia sp. DLF01]|uniref:Bug family tripartite tricarboxylate transporter substrate binding protein n=1 Tax=Delftia sp. DLF01 TaxID=2769279 RepID=UPI0017807638|nr:tripartite tricarboxylate transporter substrate binding protein [Delftia sp. DLF01]MBD9584498.1 tripartite tricarboxylate transporter substrate binding protein [Delftia sp. DLF01]